MWGIILTFFVGFFANFLSGIVGAGAGLVISPFLILMGLPPQIAVATTKFSGFGLSVGSIARFWKTRNILWRYVLPLVFISLVSGIIGPRLLIEADDYLIRKVVGVVVLVVAPLILLRRNVGLSHRKTSSISKVWGYFVYFVVAVFVAAFGSGIGLALLFVLMNFFGFTALEANATRRIPGFVMGVAALISFIAYGVVDYVFGAVLLVGALLGGYVGSHVAIAKGNAWVRVIYMVLAFVLGVKLLV